MHHFLEQSSDQKCLFGCQCHISHAVMDHHVFTLPAFELLNQLPLDINYCCHFPAHMKMHCMHLLFDLN